MSDLNRIIYKLQDINKQKNTHITGIPILNILYEINNNNEKLTTVYGRKLQNNGSKLRDQKTARVYT